MNYRQIRSNTFQFQWVDGWELNGQFFPSPRDHPVPEDDRFTEICGSQKIKRVFISSQNAALLQYRVPMKGKGFSVIVRHVKNQNREYYISVCSNKESFRFERLGFVFDNEFGNHGGSIV